MPTKLESPVDKDAAITVAGLSKTYAGELAALTDVNLVIRRGEIFALLGPNDAGKTTLISIICGIVNPTAGRVTAGGYDVVHDYLKSRALIGLVPQELTTDAFETVWNTVSFSCGLFGRKSDPGVIERVLRDLSLWDRKDSKIITLSGGMKRRVLIAKALAHEPDILFLDEPTACVDVELRRGMWDLVRKLRETGITIVLTTHYIEEAEEMADRPGVINDDRIVLVEDKSVLIKNSARKNCAWTCMCRSPKFRPRARNTRWHSKMTARHWSSPSIPRRNVPAPPGCCAIWTASASGFPISIHGKAHSRTSLSASWSNDHES